MKTMKTRSILFAALLLSALASCSKNDSVSDKAVLRLAFAEDALSSRAALYPTDTSNYNLYIKSSGGKTVFEGLWSERPREFIVDPGTYSVKAVSREFSLPMFESPQYGDFRILNLSEGESSTVNLVCTQQNCGVKLTIKDTFIANYKDANLYLRTSEGTLAYGYDETRTAYFYPGKMVVLLNSGGEEKTIYTRYLSVGEMLTLELSAAEKVPLVKAISRTGMSIRVDTTRNWIADALAFDGSGSSYGGQDPGTPASISVSEACTMAGSNDVWVAGYIVGGDLSSSSMSFDPPFTSRTNIAIADTPNCTDKSRCMSVQLSKGSIRDALNLVDNAALLGRRVHLKGDIVEAYYRIPGLQNLSDYRL